MVFWNKELPAVLFVHFKYAFFYPLFYWMEGAFSPMLSDPLPGHRKTQLVLKIISGQQLPKPKGSMLGDRGEVQSH